MQALVLNEIKRPLALEDRPDLEPAPGEVVVRLKAAALNRRDFWISRGMYPGIVTPIVLGSDGAGVVAKVGEGVDDSWMDRETIINPGFGWGGSEAAQEDAFTILGLPRDGTFATEVAVPVEQLRPKLESLTWEEAAALPLAGLTACRALFSQGGLQAGETVLITGIGGGVATFALQFAVAAGTKVWVTSSSKEKIERAGTLGAEGGFDYTTEDWGKACLESAGAPDLIIDSAGGPGYATLIDIAAAGGRIVNYGSTAGPPEKLDLFKVFWKQLRLQGSTMGSPADFDAMLKLVDQHDLKPVVDEVVPLEEGAAAVERMKTSPQFGKIVLRTE